ncbi:hypothetical protein [Acrocarpospora sp. B8E8]
MLVRSALARSSRSEKGGGDRGRRFAQADEDLVVGVVDDVVEGEPGDST